MDDRFADVELAQSDMHRFQNEGVEFLWNNPFSALLVDMGLGKCVMSATVIDRLLSDINHEDKILIIAPLKVATMTWPSEFRIWAHLAKYNIELLRESDDDPRLVEAKKIAEAKARQDATFWELPRGQAQKFIAYQVQKAETAARHRIREALALSPVQIHIINREQLEWLVYFHKDNWPYRTVIVDECFVAGTEIEALRGSVPIEAINIGEMVLTPYGFCPVKAVIRKCVRVLSKITLSDGKEIVCTPNHRFLTDIGWCVASELKDREVYGHSNDTTLHVQALFGNLLDLEVSPDFLQSFLSIKVNLGGKKKGDAGFNKARHGESPSLGSLEQGPTLVGRSERKAQSEQRWQARCIFEGSWWQWEGHVEAREVAGGNAWQRLGLQLCSSIGRSLSWLSNSLQGGLFNARAKDCNRTGWRESQQPGKTCKRFEEEREIGGIRVASVQNFACSTDVYDLSVDSAPFYYADGVLVHNCTSFKDHTSDRFKALAKVRNTPGLINRMHLLTASFVAEGYMGLFAMVYLLDRGERLGKKITHYREEYFIYNKYSMKWKLRPSGEQGITDKIKDVCLVMKADDYLPRERATIQERRIVLSDAQMTLYRQMETEFVVTLPDGSEVEAETAAALAAKLLQMASGCLYETFRQEDYDTGDFKKVKRVHDLHDEKIQMLREIVDELDGEPLLCGYHWQSSLAKLRKAFPKAIVMDREGKQVVDWNKRKITLMFIHPQSGGHGLNMQKGGHNLAYYDIPWSKELHDQLIGRIDRQGQKHPVLVQRLVASGTYDELVIECQKDKTATEDDFFAIIKRKIRAHRKQLALAL